MYGPRQSFQTFSIVEDLDSLNLHSASEEEEDPEVPLFDRGVQSDSEEEEEEPVKPKARFFNRERPSTNSQSPNPSQTKLTSARDNEEEDSVTGISNLLGDFSNI
jgi:hypothetical protein